MKNFIFILLLTIICLPVFAITNINYSDFFLYNSNTKIFTLIELDRKQLKTMDKEYSKNYRIAKKINKLYIKNENEKILKKYPNFIPSLFALYEHDYDIKNYNSALEKLEQIKSFDKNYDGDYLSLLFYKTYYAMREYNFALNELLKIQAENNLYSYIADCYLNLGQYNNAINYATKVTSGQNDYYFALETIFRAYYRQKNYSKAKEIANTLIKLEPDNPDNYIRIAECESNKNQKLNYYYLARNKTFEQNRRSNINDSIIKLEQEKIDNAHKNLNSFVEKPDWLSVFFACDYGNFDYWEKRQDDFFKSTNLCISKYSGAEQAKCFESINNKQNNLNEQIAQRVKEQQEREYQSAILRQNEMMIRQQMIRNINQINTNNQLQNINNNLQQQNFQLQNINNRLMW